MELTLALFVISTLSVLAAIVLLRRMARPLQWYETGPVVQRVSVIIPARNEEDNLPGLLESLRSQRIGELEVVVADDGSTDGTARIARELGARTVEVPPAPAGWVGKTWACRVGASASTGDVLVFLDADTRLEPGGLARIIGHLKHSNELVSVEPTHRAIRLHEQLSAVFNIVRMAGVGGGDGSPAGAFGPCLAIKRQDYLGLGGHSHPQVRGQVLEHFKMGQVFSRRGGKVHCHSGQGVINFRMYPGGLWDLVRGWSKALLDGARGTPRSAVVTVNLWLTGAVLSLFALGISLASSPPLWIVGVSAYGIQAVLFRLMLRRVGRFSWWVAPMFVVPLVAFFGIYALAAYRSFMGLSVTWRGRAIASEPESEV